MGVARRSALLDDFDQPLDALVLDLLRHLVGQLGRLGAVSRREDEGEGPVVADLLDCGDRLLELLLRLPRKADDQVGRQREIGDGGTEIRGEPHVALP